MYKATNNQLHFQARAGSFATHASARGVNLLGWDQGTEVMTPEQERESLISANRRFQEHLKHDSVTSQERKEIGRQMAAINLRLAELRPQTKKGREVLIDRYILDVLKERLPHSAWKSAVDEAYARIDRHNSRTGSGIT